MVCSASVVAASVVSASCGLGVKTTASNLGEVEWIDPPVSSASSALTVPEEYRHLADLLRRVLPELGDIYEGIEARFEDADWVGSRLVEILPISLADKQICLELLDPLRRLALLSPLIRRDVGNDA